jgi:hypothetical protein
VSSRDFGHGLRSLELVSRLNAMARAPQRVHTRALEDTLH